MRFRYIRVPCWDHSGYFLFKLILPGGQQNAYQHSMTILSLLLISRSRVSEKYRYIIITSPALQNQRWKVSAAEYATPQMLYIITASLPCVCKMHKSDHFRIEKSAKIGTLRGGVEQMLTDAFTFVAGKRSQSPLVQNITRQFLAK